MKRTRRLVFILILILAFSSLDSFSKIIFILPSSAWLFLQFEEHCLLMGGLRHDKL